MSVRYDVPRDGLDPTFDTDIYDLLAGSEYAWVVVQGLRTFLQQKGLYTAFVAGGPKAAPPGRSPHNYGLAVDVAILTENGPSWQYDDPQWKWLQATVDAHPRLHGGWHFDDNDHIEAVSFQDIRTARKQAGTW